MTQPKQAASSSSTSGEATMQSTETPLSPDIIQSLREDYSRYDESTVSDHPQTEASALQCESCESPSVKRDDKHEEIVCENCGEILSDNHQNIGASWERTSAVKHRLKTDVTSNTEAGISESPLGGTIDWRDKDPYGNTLSAKRRSEFHRLRKLDKQTDAGDRKRSNYKFALSEINRLTTETALPRYVRESAAGMYETLLEDESLSGFPIEAICVAVVQIACEKHSVSRDVTEFTMLSHCDTTMIETVTSQLQKHPEISDVSTVTEYVNEYCQALNLSDTVISKSCTLLENGVNEDDVNRNSLKGYTTAAIYLASTQSGEIRQLTEITDVSGVPASMARKHIQELIEKKSL